MTVVNSDSYEEIVEFDDVATHLSHIYIIYSSCILFVHIHLYIYINMCIYSYERRGCRFQRKNSRVR